MSPYEGANDYQQRCDIDGIPIEQHAKCRGCGILLGPGHLEPVAYEGYCASCYVVVCKQREKEAVKCAN